MTPKQAAAYLAGMIDGEGSITMVRKQVRTVVIVNTDIDLIDACAECYDTLGISYHRYQRRYSGQNPKWADKHILQVYGQGNIERIYELVPIRSKAKRATLEAMMGSWRKPQPTKEELERLYVGQGWSYKQLMEHFNIRSAATVSRLMRSYGIEPRVYSPGLAAAIRWQKVKGIAAPATEELQRMYASHSIEELARHYSVSTSTIHKWLVLNDIPRRKPSGRK